MGQARVPGPLHQPCPHATTSFRTHKSASAGLLAAMAAVALGPFRGSGVIAGGRVRQLMTAAEAAAAGARRRQLVCCRRERRLMHRTAFVACLLKWMDAPVPAPLHGSCNLK